jgi:hypothetical protein
MQFSTKTLLLTFIVAALWLSTLSGYQGSSDVHISIMLIVTTSAGVAVIYGRGRTQAFAIAFLSILFFASDFFTSYNLRFGAMATLSNRWSDALAADQNHRHWLNLAFLWALIGIWTLTVATLAGVAATIVYERCQGAVSTKRPTE